MNRRCLKLINRIIQSTFYYALSFTKTKIREKYLELKKLTSSKEKLYSLYA